ncbi:DUF1361 domain-containing protein [Nocardia asteroides]|uniref:DUF1361 domain-containing protein n=1 Tax=Nocardia asteroides TaxID=1824 RepID=UPI003424A215
MTPGGQLLIYTVALNLYAVLLIFARSWIYRVPVYRPMVLNFFLSVLPLVLLAVTVLACGLATALGGTLAGLVVLVLGLAVWLLALPNSSYLITELNLNHRRTDDPVPLWYDIIAVLSFVMSGVVNMVVSVLLVQIVFVTVFYGDDDTAAMTGAPARLLCVIVLSLVSIGMYLGRYLRFNSWDVRAPGRMWTKLREHFDSGTAVGNAVLFCLTHTVFLYLVYGLIVDPLVDALIEA